MLYQFDFLFYTQQTMLSRLCKGPVTASYKGPYQFGLGRGGGPAWAYRTGVMWFLVFSSNLKKKDPDKFTFLTVSKKKQ